MRSLQDLNALTVDSFVMRRRIFSRQRDHRLERKAGGRGRKRSATDWLRIDPHPTFGGGPLNPNGLAAGTYYKYLPPLNLTGKYLRQKDLPESLAMSMAPGATGVLLPVCLGGSKFRSYFKLSGN